MYFGVIDEIVTHKYRLEFVIRKNDNPIWKDTEKAVDQLFADVDAQITDSTWLDDEDEVSIEISYETEAHVQSADAYWDEDGGDPGYEEIEDDVSPEDIEAAIKSYGKSRMTILEDELESC